jgi:hypothetical protein
MGAGDSVVIKTCVFDVEGRLINIGEWDYMVQQVQIGVDKETGEPIYEDQVTNPLPEGAYTEEREVVYSEDHGWRLADAPAPVTDKERIEALEAALLEVILGG